MRLREVKEAFYLLNVAAPTAADVEAARERLRDRVLYTPLDYSETFSQLSANDVYLKLENLQKTGSFKLRGAYNKISTLTADEQARGVIAASAGNHAQGVAYAARGKGVPCTIVMPEGASLAKVMATQRYGARVVLHGNDYDEAYAHAKQLADSEGLTYIHAFDDPYIIAGQGTIGLEVLEQLPDVGAIVIPMGGGGLATGIALAVKSQRPDIKIIGVQAQAVPSFVHALGRGQIDAVQGQPTIADGIAVKRPGALTFVLARRYVDDVVTVDEDEIARAMIYLLERCKLVAEGAAAAGIAATIFRKIPNNLGKVVCVLSGGNVDVVVLSRIIEHGLTEAGRYLRLAVTIQDRVGALRDVLDIVARHRANVLTVHHQRVGSHIHLGQTEVEIDLETRDHAHIQILCDALKQAGYTPTLRD
ncbi:threonine ammonia-lyase [Alicyclobacillus hesperidum]|uniref:threonine ammonia-lyase n=1 Tax=Alicyclobacillus hesperidum TaxID=89784 RepID=UPI0036F34C44